MQNLNSLQPQLSQHTQNPLFYSVTINNPISKHKDVFITFILPENQIGIAISLTKETYMQKEYDVSSPFSHMKRTN